MKSTRLVTTAREAAVLASGGMLALAILLSMPGGALAQHPTLPACQANDPDLLLPDLIPEVPTQMRNTHRTGGRVIAFTTAIGNIGDGPLILEGRTVSTSAGLKTQAWQIIQKRGGGECARIAGEFIFHAAHFHWHFERFAGYYLLNSSGTLVAGGQKTTFCLLDVGMVRGYGVVAYPQQIRDNNCGPEGRQGISVGWKDIYLHNYADQFVQLDRDVPFGPVPTGTYTLVNDVDPDGLVWEKTRANNVSTTVVGVSMAPPASDVIVPPTPTPRSPHPPDTRARPTRAPRPTRGPREIIQPRERPTRVPRATRVPRGAPVPTPTPRPLPGQPVPPTVPGGGVVGPGGSCNPVCTYSLAQVRMTWYDATGLNLTALITPARNCPPLSPTAGHQVAVEMYDWLKWDRSDSGIHLRSQFTIDGSGAGARNSEGSISFGSVGESLRLGLTLSRRSPARGSDGADFPVVFHTCLDIGGQQIEIRQVCQPKSTGMLCHL